MKSLLKTACIGLVALLGWLGNGSSALAEMDGNWTFSYSDTDSTATITGYSGNSTAITIPSKVSRTVSYQEQDEDGEYHTHHRTYTYSVKALSSRLFRDNTSLSSVSIPSSVTSLGSELFSGCTSLHSVTVHGSITAIPSSCFCNCSSLSSFSIPSSVTSIGDSAFYGCKNWSPPSSFSSIKSIGSSAFSGCVKFKSVTLGPNVTNLYAYAFANCDQITDATVNSPVALPDYLFQNCSNLVTVVVGDSVKGLGNGGSNPFAYCPAIKSFSIGRGITNIPNGYFSFNNSSGRRFSASATIENITLPDTIAWVGSYAFAGCKALAELNLTAAVTYIGDSAFSGCTNAFFGHLSFPNLTRVGDSAFYNCWKLEPFAFSDTLSYIGSSAFNGCSKFQTVTLGPNVTNLGSYAFANCDQITDATVNSPVALPDYLFQNCSNLATVVLGDNVQSLGSYGGRAFANCPAIKSFTIGRGVMTIPDGYFHYYPYYGHHFSASATIENITLPETIVSIESEAFRGCQNASFGTLSLPNLKHVGDSAFSGCRELEPFVFSDALSHIGNSAFNGCSKFQTVTLGPNVTNLYAYAFANCDQITDATVNSPVALPDYLFQNCSNLVTVVVGDSVKGLGNGGSNPFAYCPAIKSFSIGRGITNIPNGYFSFNNSSGRRFSASATIENITLPDTIAWVGSYAFAGCKALAELNLTAAVTYIGDSAFSGCTNLAFGQLSLPQLTNINNSVFAGCHGLTGIKFGKGLTSIGSYAFQNCSSLSNVWFKGGVPTVGSSPFAGVASGARGHFTTDHAAEWIPQIGSDGKWQGLIMAEIPAPVLSVQSADPVNGSLTLSWEDSGAGEDMTYSVYRSANDSYSATDLVTNGFTGMSWTDTNYWSADPVLKPLNYWVVADGGGYGERVSLPVETRRRFALCIGIGTRNSEENSLPQAKNDAKLAATNLLNMAKFQKAKVLIDSDAKAYSIHEEILSFSKEVKAGDTFVFYISAHGTDRPVPALGAYDNWYTINDFQSALFSITNTASIVEIVMACHSESLVNGALADPNVVQWLSSHGFGECRSNTAWIASCGMDQYAPTFGEYSCFGEWFLHQGWGNGMADRKIGGFPNYNGGDENGMISLLEAAEYAQRFSRGISDALPSDVKFNNEKILSKILIGMVPSIEIPIIPKAPQNLVASKGVFDTKISLSWNPSDGATAYRIYRSLSDLEDIPFCRAFAYRDGEAVQDGFKLLFFREYTYTVHAINPAGMSEASTPATGWAGSASFAKYIWHRVLEREGDPYDLDNAQQLTAIASANAANGQSVLACYIAGLDPKDPEATFETELIREDGKWKAKPKGGAKEGRVYRVEAKEEMSDEFWTDVTNVEDLEAEGWRFFRVGVELAE